jgi:hypothetical protein
MPTTQMAPSRAAWFLAGLLCGAAAQAAVELSRETWDVRTSYYVVRDGRVEHSFRTTTRFDNETDVARYLAYTRQDPHATALVWHKPRWTWRQLTTSVQ